MHLRSGRGTLQRACSFRSYDALQCLWSASQDHKVTLAGTDHSIEVVPGKTIAELPTGVMPKVAIADWMPVGDGTHRAVARIHDKTIRITAKIIRQLGLGISWQTLHRLGRAGFVEVIQKAPSTYNLNLESYYAHVEAVKADPEFWEVKIDRDGVRMTRAEWYRRAI